MPPVLRALPYSDCETVVHVRDATEVVAAYQIIVWVSIGRVGESAPPADPSWFPAILDTGHNHNFAIRPSHLREWGRIDWPTLPQEYGYEPKYQGVKVPHRRANVWLHPNQYGWRDWIDPLGAPLLLEMPRGIAVYGDGEWLGTDASRLLTGPRLPLLGLRGLSLSRSALRVDSAAREVWLDSP